MLQVQLATDAAKPEVGLSQMCWQIALVMNKTEVVACLSLPSPEGRLDTGLGTLLIARRFLIIYSFKYHRAGAVKSLTDWQVLNCKPLANPKDDNP